MYFLFTGTTVWVGHETTERRKPSFEDYRFLSSHDSCWRNAVDEELTQIYFKFAEQINSVREKAGLKSVAPKDMSDNSSLG